MIKLIIFDLDGVLVDAKKIHYNTLNQALSEINNKYIISETEHLSVYDGLKTNQKLQLLSKNKDLDEHYHEKIWNKKQELTYAEQMIAKNIRVNNEFYVCPVFNEAIKDNKKIKTFNIEKMWGLGTPEDLEYFLKNYETNLS